jgi:hypothetical protein
MQKQNTAQERIGMSSGKPTVMVTLTQAKTDSGAIEAAEDTVNPKINKWNLIVMFNSFFSLHQDG